MISEKPITALSGVRSSCDTLAKNSLLATLAASASSLARRSATSTRAWVAAWRSSSRPSAPNSRVSAPPASSSAVRWCSYCTSALASVIDTETISGRFGRVR